MTWALWILIMSTSFSMDINLDWGGHPAKCGSPPTRSGPKGRSQGDPYCWFHRNRTGVSSKIPGGRRFCGFDGKLAIARTTFATGAVDALVMEENRSPPAIDQYAEKYQFALFYRELGVELNNIKALLTSPLFDKTAALREHHAKLLAKKARLELLIANVEKSIAAAEGRIRMSDQEKFEGFKKKIAGRKRSPIRAGE